MANRYGDWFRQAEADLRLARTALAGGHHEWSCFAAHQAAEKAIKAVFLTRGTEAWGHTVIVMLDKLGESLSVPQALKDAGRSLDKHYIPTRYPNGFDSGAPTDFYTDEESKSAIQHAEEILDFCRLQIHQPAGD